MINFTFYVFKKKRKVFEGKCCHRKTVDFTIFFVALTCSLSFGAQL